MCICVFYVIVLTFPFQDEEKNVTRLKMTQDARLIHIRILISLLRTFVYFLVKNTLNVKSYSRNYQYYI